VSAPSGAGLGTTRAGNALYSARVYLELCRRLAHAHADPPEPLTFTLGPLYASANALLDNRAFELGKDGQHLKYGFAGAARRFSSNYLHPLHNGPAPDHELVNGAYHEWHLCGGMLLQPSCLARDVIFWPSSEPWRREIMRDAFDIGPQRAAAGA